VTSRARRCRVRGNRNSRGSAAMLGVVVIGVLSLVALLVGTVGGVVADQRRVESAADLAALAGAAAGLRGEDACAAAEQVARRNEATLASCQVAGEDVDVLARRAVREVFGHDLRVSSRARAGPSLRPRG
jgi:secretion/DNA translocation related TadE-like protein